MSRACWRPRCLLLTLVTGGGWLLYGLRNQATDIVEKLPQAAQQLRRALERERRAAPSAIEQVQKAANELEKAANAAATPQPPPSGVTRVQVETPAFNVREYLVWGSLGVAGGARAARPRSLPGVFPACRPGISIGASSSRSPVRRCRASESPSRSWRKSTGRSNRSCSCSSSPASSSGVATWLAFRWLGLEQAALWGLLAGVFNSIPYLGPVIVTGGTAIVAFLQFGNLRMVAIVAVVSLSITSLEGFLLTPWLTAAPHA